MGISLIDAGPIAQGLFGLIDNLFTSEDEKLQAKYKLIALEQSGALAQIGVNTQEAKHASIFVAGWRPFVGWIGGVSLATMSLLTFALAFGYMDLVVFQAITSAFMTTTLPLLGGMLGLRTFDKYQGTDTQSMSSDGIDRRGS